VSGWTSFDFADLRRWAISGAVVALAHGAVAAGLATWREPPDDAESGAGVVVHLAPVPVAPAPPENELPPGPLQQAAPEAPPVAGDVTEQKPEDAVERKVEEAKLEPPVEPKVESKPVEEPPPELPPAPNPEIAMAPPPPVQEVKREAPQQQAPSVYVPATAPDVIPQQQAPVAAAPEQGPSKAADPRVLQAWTKQVFALLARNIRYPEAADRRRQTGVVEVLFALDRQGRLLHSRIGTSSGVAALDQEALDLLKRVQPFPPPPPELAGEGRHIKVPIRFLPPGSKRYGARK
jgi:protein TonB